jgi:AGZA family xanthine/uracil permease-like MFS transporter
MRWFVRGDVDGFFGLAVDNLVQLLLIDTLCRHVLGFSDALLYGQVLPGVAVSLLVGNVYYARQAMHVARAEGRDDVCALPYGINTISLFAHVFLVMLPVKLAAQASGHPDPPRVAWQAGLIACLGSGAIELLGAFGAERLRKLTPRAAMLSTLAGIALSFISLGFLFRSFARPLVGMTTLAVVLLVYFGKVRFRGGVPGGLVAVVLGTAIAWWRGFAPTSDAPQATMGLHLPLPVVGDVLAGLAAGHALTFLGIIIPMGLFNVVGSLQNIESAEAAGDRFNTTPSLAVNGAGTIVAALFGSCFPTTIYIGHPGWKQMGARAGYSLLNAGVFTLVLLSGALGYIVWAVPVDAGMAIVLWIGIVISAQAFQATPRSHAPAVVLGLLPGVAAWGALMAKAGLRAAGYGQPDKPFSVELLKAFPPDTFIHGAFALEQGFIFSAMILAAATVFVIEQRFIVAGAWCLAGAALSAVGLMHSYRFTPGDSVLAVGQPAWSWCAGYAAMSLCFLIVKFVAQPTTSATTADDHPTSSVPKSGEKPDTHQRKKAAAEAKNSGANASPRPKPRQPRKRNRRRPNR